MAQAEHIARYFLWLASQEPEEEPITNLRLQKLLYYAQGWSLASRGEPLFDGEIQAWKHGPVAPGVYSKFKQFEGGGIPSDHGRDDASLRESDKHLVRWVWQNYGKFSAGELWRMTHSEPPWLRARGSLPPDAAAKVPLDEQVIREYFGGLHAKRCAAAGIDPKQWAAAMEDIRAGRTIPLEQVIAELRRGVAN